MPGLAVNYLIDASSVINLQNADAIDIVCRLRRCHFWLSPLVVGECEPTCAARLFKFQIDGALHFVDDSQIPTDLFLTLLAEHELGEGETESIAVCHALDYDFCSDDKQARLLGQKVLGSARVIGSMRLLRWCVEVGIVDCSEALRLFRAMHTAGGFLPQTNRSYFCAGQQTC